MPLAPLDENDAAVGDGERGARVLLDQDDRDAARADLGEPREDALDQLGREARRRLVQHQHARRHDQRARDRRHLPLPAGEASRRQPALAREIGEEAVDFSDAAGALAGLQHARREPKVVLDGKPGEDVFGLRHESQAAADHERWAGSPVTSAPSSSTAPDCTGATPAIALMSVDLPAPLGPSTATISPAAAVSDAPLTIGTPGS